MNKKTKQPKKEGRKYVGSLHGASVWSDPEVPKDTVFAYNEADFVHREITFSDNYIDALIKHLVDRVGEHIQRRKIKLLRSIGRGLRLVGIFVTFLILGFFLAWLIAISLK